MDYRTVDQLVGAVRQGASIDDATVLRFGYTIEYAEVDPEWIDSSGQHWGWPGVT